MKIETAETKLRRRLPLGASAVSWMAAQKDAGRGRMKRVLTNPRGKIIQKPKPTDPVGIAYINHGRWVVDCPDGCGNAMLASEERIYLCSACGAGPYKVRWPAEREQIETVLAVRPGVARMSWVPGETVQDLENENERHGVG